MPSSDPLPPKESALFRKLLKCYEMKQYKNGLKLAKQILSNPKYTEHGETLAMKGLTLNGLGRREEAYKYVRQGLRNDLKSHVCWHVYGLLQRSDKKYDEAIKCYRNALKWEKDNLQILKDLSLLQIQMRDLEGYKETRHQLFKLRPSQHASWIGFAMSYHLLGDFETANSILETFRQSQALIETHDYRHSELLLYQNQILIESGNYDKALQHLLAFENQIVDKLAVKETVGNLYIKLGKNNKAITIYEELIKRNPENVEYYKKYFEASNMTDVQKILERYKKFQETYPHALCPKRLPLDIANGDTFREIVDQYLRRGLRKGVPPLFNNIRSLYQDEIKTKIIAQLVEEYFKNLTISGHFSRNDFENNKPKEPVSALLWTTLFMAQHYDYLRDTEKALNYINIAIEHTPTLIELFVAKGRIYKHAGDTIEAYIWLDEAQSLDTADRYINSKCAKYMLRANMVKEAETVCSKFTREGVSAMENLNEMQCMWFQTECALAYQRLGKWGEALKKCHEVDRHFAEIIEDQFDFHTYCMRKMTLRAYVGLLRLEDILRKHPFYFKAAKCAIEVYIRLHDKPLKSEEAVEEIDIENLPPSELKKLRNKQRKAKKKAELESAQAAQAAVKKEQHQKSKQQNPQDTDPDAPQLDELIPDKLERPDDPLEKAIEFLKPLQLLAKDRIETYLLAFEVYLRKQKILLMIQSINRARKIDANHPIVHGCIMKLTKALQLFTNLNPSVKVVVDKSSKELIGDNTPEIINKTFIDENKNSILHLIEGAKIMYALQPSKKEEAIKLLTNFDTNKMNLQDCTKVFESIRDGHFGHEIDDILKSYKKICNNRFPHARLFREDKIKNFDQPPSENHINESKDEQKTADL